MATPGSILEIPSQNSSRLNVLGFLTPDNQFESYGFEGTIDTEVVIAGFEQEASLQTSKLRSDMSSETTLLLMWQFLLNLDHWEKKGVIIRSLPT